MNGIALGCLAGIDLPLEVWNHGDIVARVRPGCMFPHETGTALLVKPCE